MSARGADIVIVGAGFAGVATAAALVRLGARRVRILEAEPIPGRHGTGLNAAMARRVIEHAPLSLLAARSVAAMRALERRRGVPLLSPVGGLLLGSASAIDELHEAAQAVPDLAGQVARLSRAEMSARVSALVGASAEAALWSPGCGVVDIHALLAALLEEARDGGATLTLSTRVLAVHTTRGRVSGVETAAGRVSCDVLVNAAGFGVNEIGALAGADPVAVQPARRHLFVSAQLDSVDPAWPFVWDVTSGYYFRPEGAGLLMCTCDETPWPAAAATTDPAVREQLAETFSRHAPGLLAARPARAWAGVRVLPADGRFFIGPDPRVDGLFWVAGLGGHGMTTSIGVGEVAAAGLMSGAVEEPYRRAFAVDRLAGMPGTAGVPSG